MVIPVIKFDPYKNNVPLQVTNVEEELDDALSDTGFFIATGLGFSNTHPVSDALRSLKAFCRVRVGFPSGRLKSGPLRRPSSAI